MGFGPVQKIIIPFDQSKVNEFKGFALVMFKDKEILDKILEIEDHVIENHKVIVTIALTKTKARKQMNKELKKKIFVGGLSQSTTEETLHEYFSKFGELINLSLVKDKNSNLSRCFAFLTFSDEKTTEEIFKN